MDTKPKVRRDGSVHVDIFRIGTVHKTWPLHFPCECWEAKDKDGKHITYRLRRKDAVEDVVQEWTDGVWRTDYNGSK